MTSTEQPAQINWSDDVDYPEDDESLPPTTRTTEEDGTIVITSYSINDDGKKVKNVKRIQMKLIKTTANKAVAERKKWKKFGASAGLPPGPDPNATSLGEVVMLKLSPGMRGQQEGAAVAADKDAQSAGAAVATKSSIVCRVCKGDHWTTKCPYKDTYRPLNEIAAGKDAPAAAGASDDKNAAGGSKYVPPSMRNRGAGDSGAGGSGERMDMRRDDANTIRISNLSEETTDGDVRQLVNPFGPVSRVFVGWDRELNICRGFAFVTFYDRISAQKAIDRLHGHGYDNLILSVDWSKRD